MQSRVLWVFVGCMAVIFGWYGLVMPVLFPRQKIQKEQQRVEEKKVSEPTIENVPQLEIKQVQTQFSEQITELKSSRLKAVFSNRGGALKSLSIRYPESENKFIELVKSRAGEFDSLTFEEFRHSEWTIRETREDKILYELDAGNGIKITKSFILDPETYSLKLKIGISSSLEEDRKVRFTLNALNGIEHDSPYNYESYLYALAGDKKGNFKLHYLHKGTEAADAYGVGLKNRYFAVYLYPTPQSTRLLKQVKILPLGTESHAESKLNNLTLIAVTDELLVNKRIGENLYEFTLYAGPIKKSYITKVNEDLLVLVDYTGFDFIGTFILGLLNFFTSIFSNYGIAIILTTLFVRLILFPFSVKGQVSMFKIQKLQPQIQMLKAKYKDDQKKFAMEQMKLMKENKVGYASTCWGMLIQLPVFLGMFSVFDTAIDLRHSSAFFWIHDLSQPDRLVVFSKAFEMLFFTIREVNLLPIIMTVTWFIQSLTAPKSEDPNVRSQQKIFMFMPIVFGFICYGQASGLSLYFFINSLSGIVEQYIIKRYFLKSETK